MKLVTRLIYYIIGGDSMQVIEKAVSFMYDLL